MEHQELIYLLENYNDQDAYQTQCREKIINFIIHNPNCLYRTCLEGHITASAWLLNIKKDKVLLTHHKKLNLWLQLGGHADGESNVREVALREAKEESGIDQIICLNHQIFDLDIHHIPAYRLEPAHLHFDIRFLCQVDSDDKYVVSQESHDLGWFDLRSLLSENTEESIKRMARKSLLI